MAKISEGETELKERIVKTAEKLLRRHGASKLSVVAVAREIGMSHGNVYRFFSSKSELLLALSDNWLCKVMIPLEQVVASGRPADLKLIEWLSTLRGIKKQRHRDDPEHFALYAEIAEVARDQVSQHISHLVEQIEGIIDQGISEKNFRVTDSHQAAKAVLNATMRLHHPVFVASPDYPSDEDALYLIKMVVNSLKIAEEL